MLTGEILVFILIFVVCHVSCILFVCFVFYLRALKAIFKKRRVKIHYLDKKTNFQDSSLKMLQMYFEQANTNTKKKMHKMPRSKFLLFHRIQVNFSCWYYEYHWSLSFPSIFFYLHLLILCKCFLVWGN